jgi:Mce-associated membrane protein
VAARLIATGVLLAALVFAGWSGWSWSTAADDDALATARARDEALAAGREQVAVLTSLDYHRVDEGVARWLDASTGALRDELARTDESTKNSVREDATVATGAVLDAALSELDARAGTAKMLASVEITLAKEGSAPTSARNRFVAQLTRTDAGWKLSSLDQIPVSAS